jgi:hypothetical protein
MKKELTRKYKNVTKEIIMTYLNLCKQCEAKKSMPRKGLASKPMIFRELNSRCQVDLVDMQISADGEYKFIMNCQDYSTKFVFLRQLKTKKAEEAAYNLVDIFTIIGAPSVLQSDNGREFANRIVNELTGVWPELKIVHGKPRHSQSQGSVERANQDVQNMLITWMQTSNTRHWAEGLRFIQFMKNRSYHQGIKQSPYEAMFGFKAKVGLSTCQFPKDTVDKLPTEEDLEKAEKEMENALCAETSASSNREVTENETQNNQVELKKTAEDLVPEASTETKCVVCEKDCMMAHSCVSCKLPVHVICGTSDVENEGYGTKVICFLCNNKEEIKTKRSAAHSSLNVQGAKMLKISDRKFPSAKVGDNVRVRVPDVDRGRTDPRSILTIIMAVENDFYKLGTEYGVLK